MNELRDIRAQESYRRYVIGQLRNARTRAKQCQNEIETILAAFEHGAIDGKTALDDLARVGCLVFLQPQRPYEDAAE